MTKIIAIVAMAENRVIGNDNKLPWHLPEDLKHFSKLTTGHSVLMGRKTYFSLPEKFRPLPNRKNFVVTRDAANLKNEKNIETVTNLKEFLTSIKNKKLHLSSEMLWIIGGSEIYKETKSFWDEIYLTKVNGNVEGDAFFPEFEQDFKIMSEEKLEKCTFLIYKKYN